MTNGPIKVTGADTGGAYAVAEFTAPNDDQPPPPHRHRRTTEAFYVVDGALRITLGDHVVLAEAGSFVSVPPGTTHTFAVEGTRPTTFLVIISPPELIGFFQEMYGLPNTSGSQTHDIEFVDG